MLRGSWILCGFCGGVVGTACGGVGGRSSGGLGVFNVVRVVGAEHPGALEEKLVDQGKCDEEDAEEDGAGARRHGVGKAVNRRKAHR